MNFTDEQKIALERLYQAFGDFIRAGGLEADSSHGLGTAYLTVMDLKEKMSNPHFSDKQNEVFS